MKSVKKTYHRAHSQATRLALETLDRRRKTACRRKGENSMAELETVTSPKLRAIKVFLAPSQCRSIPRSTVLYFLVREKSNMTSLQITDADIPSLKSKVALVTGKPPLQPPRPPS